MRAAVGGEGNAAAIAAGRRDEQRVQLAEAEAQVLSSRRTVRDFSARPVPRAVIEACMRAAGAAPGDARLDAVVASLPVLDVRQAAALAARYASAGMPWDR